MPKVILEPKVIQVLRELKVQTQVHKEHKVLKVLRGLKVPKV